MNEIIRRAAERVGGIPQLARQIGVSRQAIYQWNLIPAEKVDVISELTGLPKPALRPDLFDEDEPRELVSYDDDFVAWVYAQVTALKSRKFDQIDLENLIEEVEDMAQRHKDEIESRLSKLLSHLLKWKFQPEQRSPSWQATILEQRARIARRIARSPSLRRYPAAVLEAEYGIARSEAAIETGLPLERFPEHSPFTAEEALDLDFLPSANEGHQP
jgi:DNA-binding transcriptional regulator YdaS (Cro superfamily)